MVERHAEGLRTWVGEVQRVEQNRVNTCEKVATPQQLRELDGWMVGWLDGWSCLHINIKVPVNINNYRNIETDKVTFIYINSTRFIWSWFPSIQ